MKKLQSSVTKGKHHEYCISVNVVEPFYQVQRLDSMLIHSSINGIKLVPYHKYHCPPAFHQSQLF